MLSLQREKQGIKEFVEHWGVYIKEKYFGGGWLCGKIKGILDSYSGKWWNLCMDSWGEIKCKRQDLWWSSRSTLLMEQGCGPQREGCSCLGETSGLLQTVFQSICHPTTPTPKQVHELFRKKNKNHCWLFKKEQVGWNYTTQYLRLLNCFRDMLSVSCHEEHCKST